MHSTSGCAAIMRDHAWDTGTGNSRESLARQSNSTASAHRRTQTQKYNVHVHASNSRQTSGILGVKLRHWLRLVRTLERVRRSCWRAEILSDAEILDTCAEIEEYKIASDLVHPRHRTSPYCPVTKRHWIGVEWPVILREIRTLGRVSETVTEAGHVLRKRARAQCEHIPDLEEQDRAVRNVMDAMGL